MLIRRSLFLMGTVSSLLFSCTSDPAPVPKGDTGSIRVEFDNVVGDQNLVLKGVKYYNQSGEDYVVTKFNYFVSNFKFYCTDGTVYTVPQDSSYFLVREDIRSSQFVTIPGVPVGDYDHVEFMIGVDSLRNTMPLEKRKGVLDPGGSMMEDGMYWAWNSGYIFVKLEGISSHGNPVNDKFYYHIGLFGGYDVRTVNNTRTVKVKFGNDIATVTTGDIPEVHLFADVSKVFDGGSTNLKISEFNSVMGGQPEKSQEIANNYQHMFTYDHVH